MQFKVTDGEAVISSGIRAIWSQAMKNCAELRMAFIPDSVKVIGREAFMGRENLSSIVIGKSVKEIGRGAFTGNHIRVVHK